MRSKLQLWDSAFCLWLVWHSCSDFAMPSPGSSAHREHDPEGNSADGDER
jgi:hypothetical protein